MSLFNKKNSDEEINEANDICSAKYNNDGKIQIEYTEDPPIHQLYDTTRLIIDSKEENPFSDNIYNCRVSYYGKDDVNISGNDSEDFGRKTEYKSVRVGLDMDKINDGEKPYYKALMTALLDEDRVSKYLARGMQDEPDIKCGNYIGEIREDENEIYRKVFVPKVGDYFHAKFALTKNRAISSNRIESQKKIDRAIAEKQAQIASLQKEINALKMEKENLYSSDDESKKDDLNSDKLRDYYNEDVNIKTKFNNDEF